MERTLAFYRLLGLDIPAEADTAPHVEVPLPGGLKLAFDTEATITSFHPSWKPTPGRGPGGPGVRAARPGGRRRRVRAAHGGGYQSELEPFDAFWGMRYATVLDPDGTGIDLFALLPGGEPRPAERLPGVRRDPGRGAREGADVAGQVRLVGVPGAGGDLGRGQSGLQQRDGSAEPQHAAQHGRPVAERGEAAAVQGAGGPPEVVRDLRRGAAPRQPYGGGRGARGRARHRGAGPRARSGPARRVRRRPPPRRPGGRARGAARPAGRGRRGARRRARRAGRAARRGGTAGRWRPVRRCARRGAARCRGRRRTARPRTRRGPCSRRAARRPPRARRAASRSTGTRRARASAPGRGARGNPRRRR